ncbi:prion-inhibition and propagation, helo domain-containing protein [Mariannaea sp. PMI_226]|nr:prion-inhibition and propagation, helo domain-containing protein [Mariannaea sp. PMI_226]
MAEIFGKVTATADVGQLFTSCVQCLEYIQVGRHFSKTYQSDLVTLRLLGMRLSRWGTAVKIYDNPPLTPLRLLGASDVELIATRESLLQMLALFEDSAKESLKFKLERQPGEDLRPYTVEDLGETGHMIAKFMGELASRRRKGASNLKLVSWTVYEKNHLLSLINEISGAIDNLEQVFPAPQLDIVLASYCSQEVEELRAKAKENSEAVLQLLAQLATDVDKALEVCLKAASAVDVSGIPMEQADL